jgi:hypothetical protein
MAMLNNQMVHGKIQGHHQTHHGFQGPPAMAFSASSLRTPIC